MNVQLNVSYYDNKQDHSNLNMLMHTHIYPIYLYDWTLNDLGYCHNKTNLTEQSLSVAGCPPCTWKGPTHSFVLCLQDQVRKYNNLNLQQALSPILLCMLLQSTFYPITELRQ